MSQISGHTRIAWRIRPGRACQAARDTARGRACEGKPLEEVREVVASFAAADAGGPAPPAGGKACAGHPGGDARRGSRHRRGARAHGGPRALPDARARRDHARRLPGRGERAREAQLEAFGAADAIALITPEGSIIAGDYDKPWAQKKAARRGQGR